MNCIICGGPTQLDRAFRQRKTCSVKCLTERRKQLAGERYAAKLELAASCYRNFCMKVKKAAAANHGHRQNTLQRNAVFRRWAANRPKSS